MMFSKYISYILISTTLLCALILWTVLDGKESAIVQVLYVTLIVVFGLFIVLSSVSSLLYALKGYNAYWSSGYAELLIFGLLAYSIVKAGSDGSIWLTSSAALLLGFSSTFALPWAAYRVIPLVGIAAFLLLEGTAPLERGVRVGTLVFIAGVLVGGLMASRRQVDNMDPPI